MTKIFPRGGMKSRGRGAEIAPNAAHTRAAPPSGIGQPLKTVPTYDPDAAPVGQITSHGQNVLNLQAAYDALMAGEIQSFSLPTGVSVTMKNPQSLLDMIQAEKRMAFADYYGKTAIADMGGAFT